MMKDYIMQPWGPYMKSSSLMFQQVIYPAYIHYFCIFLYYHINIHNSVFIASATVCCIDS